MTPPTSLIQLPVRPRPSPRRGLTLLEVIIAMAIFLMALVAILPLMEMGLNQATEVELQALALQKAQSKMSELIAGSESLGSQADVPFTEDQEGKWRWSVEAAQDSQISNLWSVTVTVYYPLDQGKVEVTLAQKIMDPSIRAAIPATAPTNNNSSSSSNSSSSNSNTTGGSTTPSGSSSGAAASTPAVSAAPAAPTTPAAPTKTGGGGSTTPPTSNTTKTKGG